MDIYNKLRPALIRHAYKYLKSEELAEDVVQDVFIKYCKLQYEIKNPSQYLYRAVSNLSINTKKTLVKFEELSDNDSQYQPYIETSVVYKSLSPKQKEAVELFLVEGNLRKTCLERGLNYEAVKRNYAFACSALKKLNENDSQQTIIIG